MSGILNKNYRKSDGLGGGCMKLREKEQSLGKSPELRADASLYSVTQEGHWAPDSPLTVLPRMDTGPWVPGNSPRVKS